MKAQKVLFWLLATFAACVILFLYLRGCNVTEVVKQPDYKHQLDSVMQAAEDKAADLEERNSQLLWQTIQQQATIDSLSMVKDKAVANETQLAKTVRRLSAKVIAGTQKGDSLVYQFIDCDSLARNSNQYLTAVDSVKFGYAGLVTGLQVQLQLKDSIIANQREEIALWKNAAYKATDIAAAANKDLAAALRKIKHQKKWPVITAVTGFAAGLLLK